MEGDTTTGTSKQSKKLETLHFNMYVYATPHSIVTLNFTLVYSGTPLLKVIYRDSEPLIDILAPRTC